MLADEWARNGALSHPSSEVTRTQAQDVELGAFSVAQWLGVALQEGSSLLTAPDGYDAPGLEAIRCASPGCRLRPMHALLPDSFL